MKIADFGISTIYNDQSYFKSFNTRAGTLLYMSPEQLSDREYSKVN